MKPTVSPLDAHLGYWLRFVSNQVSRLHRCRSTPAPPAAGLKGRYHA